MESILAAVAFALVGCVFLVRPSFLNLKIGIEKLGLRGELVLDKKGAPKASHRKNKK